MFPASTTKGAAVPSFPDVCKTPTPGGPVPVPYPNLGTKTSTPAQKVTVKPGMTFATSTLKRSAGNEAGMQVGVLSPQYKSKLNGLHARMMALGPGNPNQWHALVDEYVITLAEYYILITDK